MDQYIADDNFYEIRLFSYCFLSHITGMCLDHRNVAQINDTKLFCMPVATVIQSITKTRLPSKVITLHDASYSRSVVTFLRD